MLSGTQRSFTSLARLASWRDELRGRGLLTSDDLVVRHPGGRSGGEAGMAELLRRGVAYTAVVCTNDLIAVGAMHTLHLAGRDVPGDVSVVGFGGYENVSPPGKPLTTIAEDYREIGRQAGELLLARIGGVPGREHRIVPTHLVVGQTTAPVATSHRRLLLA
ncbi:MAG: substrate-binding domain-containing protein [Chloroflexota bacterium]|nr:substrate-binding domain-containing protein [Chloroflexota bacterium]